MSTRETKNSGVRVPADMVALIGIPFVLVVVVPISSTLILEVFNAKMSGDSTILWAAIGLGVVGALLLFFAKLPLYRRRVFFQFGPEELDILYRRLYWCAWIFIIASIGLLSLILTVLW